MLQRLEFRYIRVATIARRSLGLHCILMRLQLTSAMLTALRAAHFANMQVSPLHPVDQLAWWNSIEMVSSLLWSYLLSDSFSQAEQNASATEHFLAACRE